MGMDKDGGNVDGFVEEGECGEMRLDDRICPHRQRDACRVLDEGQ